MSKYYRIVERRLENGELLYEYYKGSSDSFTANEKDGSRYHEVDAPTVRDDVKERHRKNVYLVETR